MLERRVLTLWRAVPELGKRCPWKRASERAALVDEDGGALL